jgi:RNA polymerase sigma factor (sigma-70 family)
MNVSKSTILPAFLVSQKLKEEDFERIFLEFYPRIVQVVYRLVGTRDEAEELTAEVFWKLWNSPPAHPEHMAGWLYRVATNLGYNALRSANRRISYETRASFSDWSSESIEDPEAEAERDEQRRQVRETFMKMPRRDVQILILRHSGCSYQEIASALKIRPTSIGVLLLRAEQRFCRIFQQGVPDAHP